MSGSSSPVISNPWQALKRHTPARIALGRSGVSQPTAPQLAFQRAHAEARDAVHLALDANSLAMKLGELRLQSLSLHSAAADRHIYLQRPDLGRRLDDASRERLAAWRAAMQPQDTRFNLGFVIADGLSALAIERNASDFIAAMQPAIAEHGWTAAPIAIVEQGRVAIGDEVGEALGVDVAVVLIGERPGLSSPDSMGLYLTWSPRPGRSDAERNCISNVRAEGLAIADAAARLRYLLAEALRRGLTGVALKDESASAAAIGDGSAAAGKNFLLDSP